MSPSLIQIDPPTGCSACRNGNNLGFELTMAFQPIGDVARRSVFASSSWMAR